MNAEPTEAQLQAALKRAVSDARVLSLLFILLGGLGFWVSFGMRGFFDGRLVAAGCGALLLAPGVLYFLAGQQLCHRQASGGRLGLWAAAAHIGVIPLLIVLSRVVHDRSIFMLMLPASLSVLFVPALIAFLFSMRRAERIARQLGETGQGFAVLPPQAVLPVSDSKVDPP